jgi:hypothetical protein
VVGQQGAEVFHQVPVPGGHPPRTQHQTPLLVPVPTVAAKGGDGRRRRGWNRRTAILPSLYFIIIHIIIFFVVVFYVFSYLFHRIVTVHVGVARFCHGG